MAAARYRGNRNLREAELETVSSAYLSGLSQRAIADRLGCALSMVAYDLGILRKRWRARSDMQFDKALAEEIAKVDNLEREYWDGWERSKAESTTTFTEQTQAQQARTRASVRKRQRDGNVDFLLGVQWCIDKRCRLMGLEAGAQERGGNVVDLAQLMQLARQRAKDRGA
jgi:hypothetical protein